VKQSLYSLAFHRTETAISKRDVRRYGTYRLQRILLAELSLELVIGVKVVVVR
jgi:hypothetical protein